MCLPFSGRWEGMGIKSRAVHSQRLVYHAVYWRDIFHNFRSGEAKSKVVFEFNLYIFNENFKSRSHRPNLQRKFGSFYQSLMLAQLHYPQMERARIDLHWYIRNKRHLIRLIINF